MLTRPDSAMRGGKALGYDRKEHDLYETPAWCVEALLSVLKDAPEYAYDPAAGRGARTRCWVTCSPSPRGGRW